MENTDNYSNLTEVPQVLKMEGLLEVVEKTQSHLNSSHVNPPSSTAQDSEHGL